MQFRRKIFNTIKKIFRYLNFPLKNQLILESHPDLVGNTYILYQYMLEKNLNSKYKIIWFVDNISKYKDNQINNVYFFDVANEKIFNIIKKMYIIATSKAIITENRMVNKINKNTFSLYLQHGTVVKDIGKIYNFGDKYDYLLCPSENMISLYKKIFNVTENQLICLGSPRNDYLFEDSQNTSNITNLKNYEKIIMWLPTFRQHKNKNRFDSNFTFPLGVPIFRNLDEVKQLDQFLSDNNMLLILKPHPAQDLDLIKINTLTNLWIIDDELLRKKQIQLYEFLPITDALITDYSNIYFDYLLLKRPIAITRDDVDKYKLGFVYDDIFSILKGEYISNFQELIDFLDKVKNEVDDKYEEREKINEFSNGFQDNQSTKRVYDFLINFL